MPRNDERTTKADAVIIRLNESMQPTVEEITVEVPYTRVPAKAAASIRELLHLGPMDSVVVKEPLHQMEYERRVYNQAEVYATACFRGRTYEVAGDGTDDADPADVLDCKRVVVDVYDYSIVCMIQSADGAYHAVKVRTYDITECRSGLNQFQAYARDVLDGIRKGDISMYDADGSMSDVQPYQLGNFRVAAWDAESKYRRSYRVACYLTEDELSRIPFTVYRRGDGDEDSGK